MTLTLAKEAENKAAKKEMNAALKLVKAKDYKGAAAALLSGTARLNR
jgi:TolA-binding protein